MDLKMNLEKCRECKNFLLDSCQFNSKEKTKECLENGYKYYKFNNSKKVGDYCECGLELKYIAGLPLCEICDKP